MKVLRCDLCGKVDDGSGIFARVWAIAVDREGAGLNVADEMSIDVCQACLGEDLLKALIAHGSRPLSLETITRLAMDERHD